MKAIIGSLSSIIKSCEIIYVKNPVAGLYHIGFVIGCLAALIATLIISIRFVCRAVLCECGVTTKEFQTAYLRLFLCFAIFAIVFVITGIILQIAGMI